MPNFEAHIFGDHENKPFYKAKCSVIMFHPKLPVGWIATEDSGSIVLVGLLRKGSKIECKLREDRESEETQLCLS